MSISNAVQTREVQRLQDINVFVIIPELINQALLFTMLASMATALA